MGRDDDAEIGADGEVVRVPVHAPEWTEHNASDPGITLLQLFAYLAESLLTRVSDAARAVLRRLTARCD